MGSGTLPAIAVTPALQSLAVGERRADAVMITACELKRAARPHPRNS